MWNSPGRESPIPEGSNALQNYNTLKKRKKMQHYCNVQAEISGENRPFYSCNGDNEALSRFSRYDDVLGEGFLRELSIPMITLAREEAYAYFA